MDNQDPRQAARDVLLATVRSFAARAIEMHGVYESHDAVVKAADALVVAEATWLRDEIDKHYHAAGARAIIDARIAELSVVK